MFREQSHLECASQTVSAVPHSDSRTGEASPVRPAPSIRDELHNRWRAARARMQVRQSAWPEPGPKTVSIPVGELRKVLPLTMNTPRIIYTVPIGPRLGAAGFSEALFAVCRLHGINSAEIIGPNRQKGPARARQDLAWRLRNIGLSYSRIGELLGGRDHTTIIMGVRAHEKRRDNSCQT